MKRTKTIMLVLAVIVAFSALGIGNTFALTMYAEDGRTIEVDVSEVTAYQNVGWYKAPVKRLYTEDGRTALFFESDVAAQLTVGWYKAPVKRLYTEDGRTALFFESDVAAQLTVGWYKAPVKRLYTKDGRTALFFESDVAAQLTVGWYETPMPNNGLADNHNAGKTSLPVRSNKLSEDEAKVALENSLGDLGTWVAGEKNYLVCDGIYKCNGKEYYQFRLRGWVFDHSTTLTYYVISADGTEIFEGTCINGRLNKY